MKIFSLLSRYTRRSFLTSFGITVLCLLILILLFDFAELQRRAGSMELSFGTKLNMVFLRAPYFLEQVLPFLVFVAALFIFWRMNRTNELLVCRASGISLWRFIIPLSFTALMIGFIDLTVFNPLTNAMHARYEKIDKWYFSKSRENVKVTSTGLWLSEKMGPNQVIYRADKINLETLEFQNLTLIITSPHNTFVERLDAKTAQIQGKHLILKEGWDTVAEKPVVSFAQKSIETSLDRKKIETMKVNRNIFSFWQLPSYILLLKASGLQSLKYQMYWHSILASAVWGGAMVLLAAAFSCRSMRQGKTVLLILMGVIVGFFLYLFKDVTFALGASGGLPPVIAAWLPPLVTAMVGAMLVFYQEDG
jgi:lipopolysaccharide export system permease protein